MIAALYVETGGVYFDLEGVDPWDQSRDARLYEGLWPVVAHPPCGPWSKMRHLCTKQDPTCGPRAFEQVRAFGGVLEQPEHSLLFRRCGAPPPEEFPDKWGGQTYFVRQVAWGHPCDKPTWLYAVGVDHQLIRSSIRTGGTATHRVTKGPRQTLSLPSAHKKMRNRTPIAFRDWLLSIAQTAQRKAA